MEYGRDFVVERVGRSREQVSGVSVADRTILCRSADPRSRINLLVWSCFLLDCQLRRSEISDMLRRIRENVRNGGGEVTDIETHAAHPHIVLK